MKVGSGSTAITAGMATATSGFTVTGFALRIMARSGLPIAGSSAVTAGFWLKVTGSRETAELAGLAELAELALNLYDSASFRL
jgi:hypothetical protein